MRHTKMLTNKEDIDFFLNLDRETCFKTSFMMDTFGDFGKGPKYHTYDTIVIPPNSYGPDGHKNSNSFTTTLGIWVFNKAFIETKLFDIFGYINENIGKKTIENIMNTLSSKVLEDKIPVNYLKEFINECNKFMPYVIVLSPAYSAKMLTCTKQIETKKKELLKKYVKEMETNPEHTITVIEKELIEFAMEYLKDDESMDIWRSGALGDIGNNFKNMYIMKGLVKDPDPNKGYNVITSSYMDGVKAKDYSNLANTLAAGPYARSKKTELGGYWEKLLLVAFQHLTIAEDDCHTKRTIKVYLTEKNASRYKYNYIVDHGRLVELTSDVMPKYYNTWVNMRFSALCESKKGICNVCMGNLFKRLGIVNVGCAAPQVASVLKNISMKSFHDSQVKTTKIDYMDAFGLK